VVGFPPGTTPEMVHRTWHGVLQNASRSISSLFLLATSGVIASWFAAEGRRGWAGFYAVAIPAVFLALAAVGRFVGGNPTAPACLIRRWMWVTALGVHLYRCEAQRPREARAEISPRRQFLELLGLAAVSVLVLPLPAGPCAAETAPADSLGVTSSRN